MDPLYEWQRFWVPRDGIVDISDAGFLVDPLNEASQYAVQRPSALSDLKSNRALGKH
jgi:hypothetical protein